MLNWLLIGLAVAVALAILASVRSAIVRAGNVGLLYRNGVITRQLEPGRYRWFDPFRSTELRVVSTLRQVLDSIEISVMTKDQFSFRIRLAAIVQISDARQHADSVGSDDSVKSNAIGMLLRTWQPFPELNAVANAVVVEEIGKLTLEAFLADPNGMLPAARARIADALPGAEVRDLLITAVTMPPEVRKMFTEVERAKREALVSLEKARGEQASLRALANAARSLNNNPQLAQLRLLQTVEVTKGPKTIVLGSLPSLMGAAVDTTSG